MDEIVAELEVDVELLPGIGGPRQLNYRPNHKHPQTGAFFLGQITFVGGKAEPGQCTSAVVRALLSSDDLDSLLGCGFWSIWEGPKQVGNVRIRSLGSNNSFKPNPLRGSA